MCIKDFNDLLYAEEKIGGIPKPSSQMDAFGLALYDCDFLDLPLKGPLHTWSRGRDQNMVLKRLDKGVANLISLNFILLIKYAI